MDIDQYRESLQMLAEQHNVILEISEDATRGMRHQRIIKDSFKTETPLQVWKQMQQQGATSGAHLRMQIQLKDYKEPIIVLCWKFRK